MTEEVIKCRCCGDKFDAEAGTFDEQLGGMVCPECKTRLRWSEAWLKREGIVRPVNAGDVNNHNYKRFSKELGFK